MNRRCYLVGIGALLTGSGCMDENNEGSSDRIPLYVWVRNAREQDVAIQIQLFTNGGEEIYSQSVRLEAEGVEESSTETELDESESYRVEVAVEDTTAEGTITVEEPGRLEVSVSEDSTRIEYLHDEPQ